MPRLIDLFCGAGGMTLGFEQQGFTTVWANDFDKAAAATYNLNFGEHCVSGSIVDLLEDPKVRIPKADVVIGGPPCQGFSLLNKKRKHDPRKSLWMHYLEVVRRSKARVFVMENVPQLLGSPEYFEIERAAKSLGFTLTAAKLLAADYGVPQRRFRAVLVGHKSANTLAAFPPKRTHIDPEASPSLIARLFDDAQFVDAPEAWNTVRDAIGDLPAPSGTELRQDSLPPLDLHFGRSPTPLSLRRYRAIPNEGMNRFDLQRRAPDLTPPCWTRKKSGSTDVFGRLWWGRPAFTIRTEFFKPEKGRYLHPEQHRPITHREAARLQSFPDHFVFSGTKTEIAKQIGNAVPPLLASRIAASVAELLD